MTQPHGTWQRYAHKGDNCRCAKCREAWRAYQAARRKAAAYGRQPVDHYVAGDKARAHLADLARAGMSRREIERVSGVSRVTLTRIASGGRTRSGTEAKILAVAAAPRPIGTTIVDSLGTRRRLRALAALGWTGPMIARELGVTSRAVTFATRIERPTTADMRARVAALYDRVGSQRPTYPDNYVAAQAEAIRRRALARGWAPPAAWDDIDDPDETPWTDDSPRGAHVPGHGVVNADSLTDCAGWGLTVSEAADRLGVSRDAIEVGITRHAPELRETFARNLAAAEDAA